MMKMHDVDDISVVVRSVGSREVPTDVALRAAPRPPEYPMPSWPAGQDRQRRRHLLAEVSLMLAGGLVGHAVTAVASGHLLGAANPGVHGFRPGAALVAVAFALVVLTRHHVVDRRSSSVVAFPVVVGQQGVLVAILALEWTTAGRLEQIAHDPWLWLGGVAQLLLVGAWRLLEGVAMALADGSALLPAGQGIRVAQVTATVRPRRRAWRVLAGASTRAPPGGLTLPGPAG